MANTRLWKDSRESGCNSALQKLDDDGLTPECQRMLGALIVYAGTFERLIELAAWAVLEVPEVAGTRPKTDKGQISEIIRSIERRTKARSGNLGTAIDLTCAAATDLLAYRNAIAHGWLMPSNEGRPYFLSNVSFHSEIRGRPRQDAHISQPLLEMAVDSAFSLCFAARRIHLCCSGHDAFNADAMSDFVKPLQRAASQARELKNLTALDSSERN